MPLKLSGSLEISGSIVATGGITVSGSIASASFATTAISASQAQNAVSASFATTAITASFANAFTVAGSLTAQTLVVQTVTSSVVYSSGSNVFGNNISNTHQFTGSVLITGSSSIVGSLSGTSATFSGNGRFNGSLNINGAAIADRMFQVTGTAFTTGITQFGMVLNPTFNGTISNVFGVYAGNNFGTGTITNSYNLYVEGTSVGSSTVINRWGIYQAGTSDRNYFAGNTLIKTTTDNGTDALQVAGSGNFSSSVTAGGRITSGPGAFRVGGFYIPYGGSTASRNWAVTNDEIVFGDFSIITSTTQTGDVNLYRLYINPSGNVGIGTTSPFNFGGGHRTLDIRGGTTSSIGAVFAGNSDRSAVLGFYINPATGGIVGTSSNHYLQLVTNDAERVRITSGGNVGIGTTSPFDFGGGHRTLDIRGGTTSSIGAVFAGNSDRSAVLGFYINPAAGGTVGTSSNHYLQLVTNDMERVRITSGGNVGIGTATPNSNADRTLQLHNGGTGSTYLKISNSTSGNGINDGLDIGEINSDTYIINRENGFMAFWTNSTERMRITSDGNVGIGTINPNGGRLHIGDSGDDNTGIYINNNTFGHFFQKFAYQGNIVGSISYNGSNTVYTTTSDYRLKQDLKDYNGLSVISAIKTYDCEWKSDKTRAYGVVAHELQEIIPYAVVGDKDGKEMQGVDYSKIVPVLVKAIQELKAEIDELKSN